jgi:hypothetical protein
MMIAILARKDGRVTQMASFPAERKRRFFFGQGCGVVSCHTQDKRRARKKKMKTN